MHIGTKSQLIAAFAAACLFFSPPSSPGLPENDRQATQGRTLNVQLNELSALVSKSSGIEQHFEYHVDKNGWVTIINDRPEDFVHIFRLTNSNALNFELRELRGVRFLADYAVEGATTARVSNPAKDSNRQALVVLREIDSGWQGPTAIGDLTALASVADEPLELNGYMHHDHERKLISPKGDRAAYNRLKYLMVNRASLRNQDGSLRFDDLLQHASLPFLYIVDNWPDVHISYAPMFPCTPDLADQLTKRVSRHDLLRQIYKKPIVSHDDTSTYRGRLQGINKMFRNRRYVDLVLFEQALRYEDGVWRVERQGHSAVKPIQCSMIFFERIGGRLLITNVFP